MSDLYCVKLGESMRSKFAEEIKQYAYGEALLVLPGRLLLQKEQEIGKVRAVNMDYLPNEILRANNRDHFVMLSRRAQEMLVKNIVEESAKAGELHHFQKLAETDAFIKTVTGFIGELARAGITAEEFEDVLSAWDRENEYGLKDEEISAIYSRYREMLINNNWYDMDGLYRLASFELENPQSIIPWHRLYFSEFYKFDQLQLEFIRALKDRCGVTIGIVGEADNDKLYGATLPTIGDLMGMGFKKHKVSEEIKREASLEHFCQHWKREVVVFDKPSVSIKILEATSAENEMRQVLESAKKRLTEGAAHEDILLVVRKLDVYNGFKNLFDEYGVPTTLPAVTGFFSHPLVELLNAFLHFAENSFDLKRCLDLLGCNFSKLLYAFDGEAISELVTKRYFANSRQLREYLLNQTEVAGAPSIEILFNWAEKIPKAASCAEYCALVRAVLNGFGLAKQLGQRYQQGELSLEQLKNILATEKCCYAVLDEIENVYEESNQAKKRIGLTEFIKIWQDIGLEKNIVMEAGNPEGICVIEAANVQGMSFKHVYLLGLREGEFPAIKQENWLYNDQERKELKDLGVDLRNTGLALAEDQYFFASTIAAATETLTISYFADEQAGSSGYFEELRQYYKENLLAPEVMETEKIEYWSDSQFAQQLGSAENLGEREENWLLELVGTDYKLRRNLDRTRFSKGSPYQGSLGNGLQQMVQDKLGNRYSSSILETYAFCPFEFLINKIWRTEEWQEVTDEIDAVAQGDLYHEVLAKFFKEHLGSSITGESSEKIEKELRNIFDEVCDNFIALGRLKQTEFLESEKQQAWSKIVRVLRQEQTYQNSLKCSASKILPAYLEWGFGVSSSMTPALRREIDNEEVFFTGRIDRIDADENWLTVTDYKRSGVPTKNDMKSGLDLQMPIYLLAVNELLAHDERQVLGGGYFSIDAAERKNGFWRDDAQILPWVQRGAEDWPAFVEQAEDNLARCVRGIRSGDYPTVPAALCPNYCPGKDICRYSILNLIAEGGEADD